MEKQKRVRRLPLEDDELYRRAKERAERDGVPLASVVRDALRNYLGANAEMAGNNLQDPTSTFITLEDLESGRVKPKVLDWELWNQTSAEFEALDAGLAPGPADLSNVKKYLYGAGRVR